MPLNHCDFFNKIGSLPSFAAPCAKVRSGPFLLPGLPLIRLMLRCISLPDFIGATFTKGSNV